MLIRRDQTRKMLTLVHEAREIGAGAEQKLRLVTGIHQIRTGSARHRRSSGERAAHVPLGAA